MKKTTRLLSLALVLVLCLSVLPVGAAAATTKGWVQSGDYWYYYENGSPATGWRKISNTWYYFWSDGTMAADEWLEDPEDSNNWYWFKSSGAMAASQWVKNSYTDDESGTTYTYWYYQLSNGKSALGWQKIGGVWYYFDPDMDGLMVTGGPIEINGSWYYFKDSGALYTGWKQLPYYDEDGNITGYGWAYFTDYGAVMNNWKKVSGKWYFFDSDGAMVTGWRKVSGTWYYFNASGAMQTGWLYDGAWYYLKSSGAMATGWLKISGTWYYFNASGAMQ